MFSRQNGRYIRQNGRYIRQNGRYIRQNGRYIRRPAEVQEDRRPAEDVQEDPEVYVSRP